MVKNIPQTSKSANQVQPNSARGNDKGKEKIKELDVPSNEGWQQQKKVITLKQGPYNRDIGMSLPLLLDEHLLQLTL